MPRPRRVTLNEQGELTTAVHLVVICSDFHRASLQVREQLALSGERLDLALRRLSSMASEGVILSTCNRVEVYAMVHDASPEAAANQVAEFLASSTGVSSTDVADATVALTGTAAVRHLFRVAAGLESMVLGEPQILGQIRDAFQFARTAGTTGPVLSRLFNEALRVGKLARTQTGIARNKTSIAHAAVALAAREFASGCPILVALDRMDLTHLPCPSPIAHSYSLRGRTAVVVGAGPMGTLAAKLLRSGEIGRLQILNRTHSRGEDLAGRTGGEAWSIDRLPEALGQADLVVVATGGIEPSITLTTLAAVKRTNPRPVVMIDVGVPRCVHPEVGADPRVLLRDVDDLAQISASFRSGQASQVIHVEHLVADGTRSFQHWQDARRVTPTITALRMKADGVREAELARALARLSHLSDRDQQVIAALASGITSKLLHAPTAALTRSDNDRRVADAETVDRLFGLNPVSTTGPETARNAPVEVPATVCPVVARPTRRMSQ